ncbi:MAG TPA: nitrogen regulation protein NR(I) [Alphaproteobacteria bacterium]|nr:nitrogen regulation protein NR(I) [Alphaproteobacteria bacterium]
MSGENILIVDDDAAIRKVLGQALSRAGYAVQTTSHAATLWRWVEAGEGDLVITDVVMPDEDGLELLPRIRKKRPDLPVIVMSARNTLMTALRAAERGAYDYLAKPFDINQLHVVVKRALRSKGAFAPAPGEAAAPDESLPIIGRSPAMQETYRLIARLVTTDLSVLITGESGTGKELVARVLHDHGSRRHGNFVAINMAAIPKELIESELFGHEKGAFTGATTRQAGRFEQADHGTLLLDEIGDMPFEAQTRLLRVLQEGEYTSVGGRRPIRTDVRIIAATNHNLRRLVEQGLFREDLYYRLNVAPLRLPALRERTADIPDLVRHFLAEAAAAGLPHKVFEPAALDRLERYGWPGNVRELENLVRRVTALAADDSIGADVVDAELADASDTGGATESAENLGAAVERQLSQYFAAHPGSLPPAGLYGRVLREIERPLLTLSLQATGGNQIRAAALLGLNRNTLRKKVRELEIPVVRGLK